jgi:hypothetical protein
MLQRLRKRAKGLTRLVLGGFLAVWINMAAQPCVMALEQDDPMHHGSAQDAACPHCPETSAPACPHCPDAGRPAGTGSERCTFVDSYDYDGRTPAPGELIKAQLAILLPAAVPLLAQDPAGRLHGFRVPTVRAAHHPPPYLSHCRFIE